MLELFFSSFLRFFVSLLASLQAPPNPHATPRPSAPGARRTAPWSNGDMKRGKKWEENRKKKNNKKPIQIEICSWKIWHCYEPSRVGFTSKTVQQTEVLLDKPSVLGFIVTKLIARRNVWLQFKCSNQKYKCSFDFHSFTSEVKKPFTGITGLHGADKDDEGQAQKCLVKAPVTDRQWPVALMASGFSWESHLSRFGHHTVPGAMMNRTISFNSSKNFKSTLSASPAPPIESFCNFAVLNFFVIGVLHFLL